VVDNFLEFCRGFLTADEGKEGLSANIDRGWDEAEFDRSKDFEYFDGLFRILLVESQERMKRGHLAQLDISIHRKALFKILCDF